MPKYYHINEEAARRAKNANSFSDYVPGSATAAYREMVDRAYALGEQQKGRVDPMYHEKIDGLIDRYARKLAENINQSNLIDARVPSILIAGGSNFPMRKKEKQNAARDKNMGEYMQIEGLLDKVRSTGMGGYIDADHFESAPFDAALIALAPLWQKADVHEIEEFLFKWEHILRNDEEMDADIRSYIKELGSLVDLLMQR